ncbi:hypothetical protein KBY29_05410 [Ruegeria pomeroyi]|nr:hypothetical protein [Ruegeria pomeroyi]
MSRIRNSIWEAGPEAVAQEIARIEAAFLAEKLPLAETVELNPDTGRFRVVPIPVQNPPLMSALLTHISDALDDALQGPNGLSERSSEYRKITRAVTRYGNNPQQAELTLTVVAKGLRRQIHDTGELPDSEDNIALLEAVEEGVRGIRANHPEVATNREQLARQALSELGPEDKALLEQAAAELIEISEGEMAEDFAEDIPALVNDALLPLPSGAPPLPGADAAIRVFGRVSRMAMLRDDANKLTRKGAKTFDSDLVKTVRLADLATKLSDGIWGLLYAIIQIGLRIFGAL